MRWLEVALSFIMADVFVVTVATLVVAFTFGVNGTVLLQDTQVLILWAFVVFSQMMVVVLVLVFMAVDIGDYRRKDRFRLNHEAWEARTNAHEQAINCMMCTEREECVPPAAPLPEMMSSKTLWALLHSPLFRILPFLRAAAAVRPNSSQQPAAPPRKYRFPLSNPILSTQSSPRFVCPMHSLPTQISCELQLGAAGDDDQPEGKKKQEPVSRKGGRPPVCVESDKKRGELAACHQLLNSLSPLVGESHEFLHIFGIALDPTVRGAIVTFFVANIFSIVAVLVTSTASGLQLGSS